MSGSGTASEGQARARGRFVTIEGGEGTGKSTQVARLVATLETAGIAARSTREPGGSPGAEAIRRLLLEGDTERWDAIGEALLLNAARRDHVTRSIAPALEQGIWIVSDRFADSTLAYQGYGRGVPLAELQALHRLALGDFAPDLTIILNLPVEEGLWRAARRPGVSDRFERLDRGFHERLHRGFGKIAAAEPGRCVLIDASGTVDIVHEAIIASVAERLGVSFGR